MIGWNPGGPGLDLSQALSFGGMQDIEGIRPLLSTVIHYNNDWLPLCPSQGNVALLRTGMRTMWVSVGEQ